MSFCQDIYDMLCKKYPNTNIYLISDHHFGHHNIINYTRKEFTSIDEMHECIIDEHNKMISDDDIVIFLGDFSFKTSCMKDMLPKLNGHKFLILGNHDYPPIVKSYPAYGLEAVYINPVRLDGDYLSHEPLVIGERDDLQFRMVAKEFSKCVSAKNYHGHIHTEERLDPELFTNVTCEALDYKPLLVGRTKSLNNSDKELFINSPHFDSTLNELANKYHVNQRVLLQDYIYSSMLSSISELSNHFYMQGSYGLYRKYGFVSDFSDMDVSYMFEQDKSKSFNMLGLKFIADRAFKGLKDIDKINISFLKLYSSLRILEARYTTTHPYSVKCYLDANLVFLDPYKSSDFYNYRGESTIANLLSKSEKSLLDEYLFPKFKTKVILPEADMANLILQVLFEKELSPQKKALILKKLNYIYTNKYHKDRLPVLQNIFVRFFLRNICLLHALNRYDEISYIQSQFNNIPELLDYLPYNIKEVVMDIIMNSPFMDVYNEVSKVNAVSVVDTSNELIKTLK